ncbi:hypothetical protein QBC39DRAFT_254200 [Podospora conica]|nr:hypothetical protein QBC39DRAFT_254200 [Schizothecium conicum]
MASSRPKNQFPGLGLPVHHQPKPDSATAGFLFPLAIDRSWVSMGVTLREMRMLSFMGQITDKPDWDTKVFDETIVSRWRAEADARPAEPDGDVYMSKAMFDYCIAELRDKAEQFKRTGHVNVLDAEVAVVKSDVAISGELQNELRAAVRVLEEVPDNKKDWHPHSNETVLDLVHPSLYPVIWGVTRALEEGTVPLDGCISMTGKGVTLPPYDGKGANPYPGHWLNADTEIPEINKWGDYQWLPAEVELGEDGSAKIMSYVNNLHPVQHKDLYGILGRIVAATVPLWKETLEGFGGAVRLPLENTGSFDYRFPKNLRYQIPGRQGKKSFWDPGDDDGEGVDDDDEGDDFDEDWKWDSDYHDWMIDHRILQFYDPPAYKPSAERRPAKDANSRTKGTAWQGVELRNGFPARFQVIFKLANIHLTPDKPAYEGGTWHVEGTLTERICASAIYYYDQDNITDSHLAFRQGLDNEELCMVPEQNEFASLEAYLGVTNEEAAVQRLGQVLTREGRLLVFPNCLQHQVQPFKLQDASRPGHRKILAMFLVDPHRPVLSSATVPPQRRDWWADEVRAGGGLAMLPAEIFDLTVDAIDDFPISQRQAEEIRLDLMKQRGMFTEKLNQAYQEEVFSFCEH